MPFKVLGRPQGPKGASICSLGVCVLEAETGGNYIDTMQDQAVMRFKIKAGCIKGLQRVGRAAHGSGKAPGQRQPHGLVGLGAPQQSLHRVSDV